MKKLLGPILSFTLAFSPMAANAQASGGANIAKMILGMSNGIVGATVLATCKLGATQPSVLVYSAGGIIYVASELLIGKAKGKAVAEIANSVDSFQADSKSGADTQLKMLDAQIKDEEETLKFIKKRKLFMDATKIIYTGATILAIIELASKFYGKDDSAVCTPNSLTDGTVRLITLAYSSVSNMSELSVKGAATGVGMGLVTTYAPMALGKLGILKEGAGAVSKGSVPLLNSGASRIGFFGVAAGLSIWVASDLGKQAKRSEKNIDTMKLARDQFKKDTSEDGKINEGDPSPNPNLDNLAGNQPVKNGGIINLPTSNSAQRLCMSNTGGSLQHSSAACSSVMKFTSPKLNSKFYDPSLQRFTNTTHDLANAMASGDMEKAEIEIGNLQSQAGNLDKLKDKLLADLNEKLKKDGKPAIKIDTEGEIAKQIQALDKSLQEKGISNFGESSNMASTAPTAETEEDKKEDEGIDASVGATSEIAVAPAAADEDLMLGTNEGSSEFENSGRLASLGDRLEEFESTEGDVVTDPGVSIFKQVSNRYLLNYEKVLNRKEIPQEKPADND